MGPKHCNLISMFARSKMSLQPLAARQRTHLRQSQQRNLSKRQFSRWPIIRTASLCDRPNTSTARQVWHGKARFLSRKLAFMRRTKVRPTDSNLRPYSLKPLCPPPSHQTTTNVQGLWVEAWKLNPPWISLMSWVKHIIASWIMPQSADNTRCSTQVITRRSKWFPKKFNGKAEIEMGDMLTIR